MTKEKAEDHDELMDVEIREYLEGHQLSQRLVEEIAESYLNIAYIRERIRVIYPDFFRDIAPKLKAYKHGKEKQEINKQDIRE